MKEVGKGGLRQKVTTSCPGFHWSCIESHTSVGIPDLHYTKDGVDGFVELKVAGDKDVVTMRPSQLAWFLNRVMHGGFHQYILIQSNEHGYFLMRVDANNVKELKPKMTLAYIAESSLSKSTWRHLKDVRMLNHRLMERRNDR